MLEGLTMNNLLIQKTEQSRAGLLRAVNNL